MHGKQFIATDFDSIDFHVTEKSLLLQKSVMLKYHLTKSVRNNQDNDVIVCNVSVSLKPLLPLNQILRMHIAYTLQRDCSSKQSQTMLII